jgi:hypothetical protein
MFRAICFIQSPSGASVIPAMLIWRGAIRLLERCHVPAAARPDIQNGATGPQPLVADFQGGGRNTPVLSSPVTGAGLVK